MKASVAMKLSTSLKATPTRELMEDRTALSVVNLEKTAHHYIMGHDSWWTLEINPHTPPPLCKQLDISLANNRSKLPIIDGSICACVNVCPERSYKCSASHRQTLRWIGWKRNAKWHNTIGVHLQWSKRSSPTWDVRIHTQSYTRN